MNCFKREANLDFLKPLNLELNQDGKRVKGGFRFFLEQTSLQNVFVAGDILHAVVHNEPAAAISGKRVAKYVHGLLNKDFGSIEKLRRGGFDFMPYCLFSTPEIAGVGLTETQATLSHPEGGFATITLEKPSLEDSILAYY